MEPSRSQIMISEAIFVAAFWLVAFGGPYLVLFQIRESFSDIADHVPVELNLMVSGFSTWFTLYILRFHQDLIQNLSLGLWRFIELGIPIFIPIFVRDFVGWKEMTGMYTNLGTDLLDHDRGLAPYKYAGLKHMRGIRLLQLRPCDSDTAPLVCSVQEEVLDVSPPFQALSYAWDDDGGDGHVICDGAVLRVSKNCAAALRRIRVQSGRKPKSLWVDAICIDQKSPEEKVRQLAIMGEIYKKAEKVIVWLGEHDKSSVRVLEFFEVVAHSYTKERKRSETTKEALLKIRRWHLISEALVQFFNRSWFTRMWPIQEVTLPDRDRVRMLCGDTDMPFEYLRFGWDVMKDLGILPTAVNLDQAVALQFYIADALALKRNQKQNPSSVFSAPLITDLSQFSLSGVMNATRYKACKYPKDKFFALYGVFHELGISLDINPSMYNSHSDSDIMRLVMMACLKHDGNLDVLRLCQYAEPYIPSDDFVRTRQDPYDSFSTAVVGMTRRLGRVSWNVFIGKDLDHVSGMEWRGFLPSWAPDWTQWTRKSLDPIRDIKFLPSYSSIFVLISGQAVAIPQKKSIITSDSGVCGICSEASGPENKCPGSTAHYMVFGSVLTVEAKTLGIITDLGSVDSVAVLWQVLVPTFSPHTSKPRNSITAWSLEFGNSRPDPALSALVETGVNFVWRSRMAQFFISLRMAVRTLSLFDFLAYSIAIVNTILWNGPWSKELLCTRYSTTASCPTDGFSMRSKAKRSSLSEVNLISTMIGNFVIGAMNPLHTDLWYDLTGTGLAILSYLLWDCRVSISESLFGGKYEEMDWWALAPLYVYIMSALVQTVATAIGDTVFHLLGQAAMALSGIWGFVVFLVWARVVTVPMMVIFAARACYKSPWHALRGMFGSEGFRLSDTYTPGMNFFSTEAGITGNTSGPVKQGDVLVQVRGCCDYLILRRKKKGFVCIGAAYVGNKERHDLDKEDSGWSRIDLC